MGGVVRDHGRLIHAGEHDPGRGVLGFNDLCTDSKGRIYVGSVAFVASDEGRSIHGAIISIDNGLTAS